MPNVTGLCSGCRHHAWIQSGRGSRFLRCELSFVDPRFPKFPVLPVFHCSGYEPEPLRERDTKEHDP